MTSENDNSPKLPPVEDLLDVLDLTPAGQADISVTPPPGEEEAHLGDSVADIFVGRSQPMPHGRVFGGQVLAQSMMAAGRTVADQPGDAPRPIHSLHAYFIRAGDASHPIRFAVERLRDGNSFSVRRVHAMQYGHTILSMTASFQTVAEGLDHQAPMPAAPNPERLPTEREDWERHIEDPSEYLRERPIDQRHVEDILVFEPGPQRAAEQKVWMKCLRELPQDPLLHAAVLAYASDSTLLESILRRHGMIWSDKRLRVASLDHAMWFHRPVHADQWMLYDQDSPSASGGRGLSLGKVFAADGTLVATVAQEGMVRVKNE